ncbi:CBS domain-containing protein [Comamonas sp.]|uniref:HPP family protein n=1 Tax=Comamonas sp. TaxID=34028 RepID=UPI003A9092F2
MPDSSQQPTRSAPATPEVPPSITDTPSLKPASSADRAPAPAEPLLTEHMAPVLLWLRNFLPSPVGTNAAEGLRMAVGVALGLLITALISRWWDGHDNAVWIVSSMGATAVLVFGMPASPLAQPWPVLAGSLLCMLVGTLSEHFVPDEALALALAVGLSVTLMVPLRCLHPPAVGLASFVVLEHAPGMGMLLFPTLFNIVVLLACAVAYALVTGKRYPHPQHSHRKQPGGSHFTDADLNAALAHYNQVLDISRADLEGLLHLAGRAAFQRTLGDLRCADIMSQPVFAVQAGATLKEAWALMHEHRIKALPVVNEQQQVIGIISNADFVRNASQEVPDAQSLGQRLKSLVMGKSRHQDAKSVQDLMAHTVQTAYATQRVMELVPLFSSAGHHHLPVVDAKDRLVGIITQTDLIRVLAATVSPGESQEQS